MKKFLISILFLLSICTFVGVNVSVAAGPPPIGLSDTEKNLAGTGEIKDYNDPTDNRNKITGSIVPRVASYTATVVSGLAVLFIVINAVKIIASGGREEKIETGKKGLTMIIFALLIMALSYSIVKIIINFTSL